jgi:phospholipase C
MGAMDEIRHIIVLMLENQSFDRLLGYVDLGDPAQKLEGLTGAETNPVAPPGDMTAVPVQRITAPSAYVTDPGPGHDFEDVNEQLFVERKPQDTSAPRNAGFVLNYSRQVGPDRRPLGSRGREVMHGLDPTLVPIITTLARSFTVCDHWFSSVPGPTWPNRFFLHAGTAKGFIETPEVPGQFISQFWTSPYDMPTIFENLMERGLTWTVYFDDYAQAFALRRLHPYGDRFQRYEQFARDVEHGTLPTYAFVEPRSFSAPGFPANDQHPPHDLLEGEKLIAEVYDTLRADDALWRTSLMVVLYDEHGGFYDHVPPPRAVSPDGSAARPSGFRFDRLGVRVPAILISPWVAEGRVDHTVYDHTSIPATIKKMFGLPRFLTARDAAASTFDRNFLPAARTVSPTNLRRLVPTQRAAAASGGSLSAYQRSLKALAQAMGSPPAAAPGAGEATRAAQAFLQQPQSP